MKYSYFPGCSLKGTGRAYEESLLPVMKELGVGDSRQHHNVVVRPQLAVAP